MVNFGACRQAAILGLLCVVALVISPTANAATYYVDATNGDDGNNGTSQTAAWQSIQRVNSASFSPGDAILLKRGEVWREQLFFMGQGAEGAPIRIGAYGSGDNPVIDGSEAVSGWTSAGANTYTANVYVAPEVVVFNGVKGTRANDLGDVDAAFEWYWADNVLTVYAASSPTGVAASARRFVVDIFYANYVTVEDLTVRYAVDPVRLANTTHVIVDHLTVFDSAGYAGIIIGADAEGCGQDNTVSDCTVYNMSGSLESLASGGAGHGIFVWGASICRDNTITGNTVHDNGGSGILVVDGSYNTVANNIVYQHGGPGIVLGGLTSSGNVIERNHVYENCQAENDRFGINAYMPGDDNVIRYNIVHDQHVFTDQEVGVPGFTERSGGIRFDGDTWIGVADKTGNKIYYNVIYNEYEGIQIFNYSNVEVYNNTVYNSVRSGLYAGCYGALNTANNNVFRNNLLHTSEQHLVLHRNAAATTFSHNVYFPDGSGAFNWNDTTMNFATWQGACGGDAQSLVADPLLVDPASADFHLQPASPCVDAATAVGLSADFAGGSVPQGDGPDVGAYEAQGGAVDTTPPVITLSGPGTLTLEVGSGFTDPGATAYDETDGDLTGEIIVDSNVDVLTLGTYTVTYDVSDAAGNAAAQVVRTVHVVDTTAPVITRLGDAEVSIEAGSAYTDPGATASDNYDGDLTSAIVVDNDVDAAEPGVYTVTYDVADSSGNAATQVVRTVYVVDTATPVITLLGPATVTLEVGSAFTDPGATAYDATDGDLTGAIVVGSNVNVLALGAYAVTYNVTDSSGNAAAQVVRTVHVVDTTAPAITRLGDPEVILQVGSTYTDPGAAASDNYDGDLTPAIIVANNVDATEIGVYTVTYDVADSSGNAAAQVARAVHVVDTTTPVITRLGDGEMTVEVGSAYTDPGAAAYDATDGDLTDDIVVANNVDVFVIGTYAVTYDVTDSSGNPAVQVVRTVHVVDTTSPVITRLGGPEMTVEAGSAYNDPGATAYDATDGDLTDDIVVANNVDVFVLSTYTVTYDVTDSSGNPAVQMVRTVHVVDTTSPVITRLGDAETTIEVRSAYTDPGATALDNYDGDLTPAIVVANDVDATKVGAYTVTYDVADSSGNEAQQVTRTVNVVDTTKPVITLLGDE